MRLRWGPRGIAVCFDLDGVLTPCRSMRRPGQEAVKAHSGSVSRRAIHAWRPPGKPRGPPYPAFRLWRNADPRCFALRSKSSGGAKLASPISRSKSAPCSPGQRLGLPGAILVGRGTRIGDRPAGGCHAHAAIGPTARRAGISSGGGSAAQGQGAPISAPGASCAPRPAVAEVIGAALPRSDPARPRLQHSLRQLFGATLQGRHLTRYNR